jgi:hypothetical protein
MSYVGSGYLSTVLACRILCYCGHEWDEDVPFDDMKTAHHETECPECKDYVIYEEDLNWVE